MHFKGHVDDWCHQHCDPYKFPELEKVWMYMIIYDCHIELFHYVMF